MPPACYLDGRNLRRRGRWRRELNRCRECSVFHLWRLLSKFLCLCFSNGSKVFKRPASENPHRYPVKDRPRSPVFSPCKPHDRSAQYGDKNRPTHQAVILFVMKFHFIRIVSVCQPKPVCDPDAVSIYYYRGLVKYIP